MIFTRKSRQRASRLLLMFGLFFLASCNLGRPRQQAQQLQITRIPDAGRSIPSATPQPVIHISTIAPATAVPLSTQSLQLATRPFTPPTSIPIPADTPLPFTVFIQSPFHNAVVAGDVQVIGSASHPSFSSYRVEYSNDPNPQNLWFPVTGDRPNPVFNHVLGVWSTAIGVVPDGRYQLRLRVTLGDGSAQSYVVSNVQVKNQIPSPVPAAVAPVAAPSADFVQSADRGIAPLQVNFTSHAAGNITAYQWHFGDGGSSLEINPAYTYRTPGAYTVTFTVTGPGGSSSFSRGVTVESVSPPVANFEASPQNGQAPLTVQFTSRTSGQVTAYRWNFGDGSETVVEANPSHTYENIGAYNVELVASGPGGQSSASRQVEVSGRQVAAPTASFDISVTDGAVPFVVQMTDTSSGAIDSRRWDFNSDGITDSTEREAATTYNDPGEHTVRLTVSGPGGESTATRIVIAREQQDPAIASFSADPTSGFAPLLVKFTNTSVGADIGYAWDFDNDGVPESTATHPDMVFDRVGSHIVLLIAAGSGGSSTASAEIIVVEAPPAPTAAFAASVVSGTAPLSVDFVNQSTGEISAYEWDFQSDGIPDSAEASPSFTFESAGTFNVYLKVLGPGGSSEATSQIVVAEALPAPQAGFLATVTNLTVEFVSSAVGDSLTYLWDFGDGNTSAEANPTHSYAQAGSYRVNQTVSNAGGDHSYAEEITVNEPVQILAVDLDRIVFVSDRDGNNEIYIMNSDGSDARNLTNNPANDRHPAWSPDGRAIAFASRRDDDTFDIYFLDLETLAVTRLTHQGANTRPSWSPDGSRIAFVSNRHGDNDIHVMNADGSDQRQLTFDITNDDQPTWSPDGTAVAYAAGDSGQRDIHVISAADGSVIISLTSDPGDDFQPAWLNDSERSLLAFTSARSGNQDIYVIDPESGAGLRQITTDASNERQPAWSSDGEQIVFVSDRANNGERNIYLVAMDGTNLQRVTPDGSNDREPRSH